MRVIPDETGVGESPSGLSMFETELLRLTAYHGPLEYFMARRLFDELYDVEIGYKRFSTAWDKLHERGFTSERTIADRHIELTSKGWVALGGDTPLR